MNYACLGLILFIAFYGCRKTVDDTDQVCQADCTTIRGKIITKDNRPLPNVGMLLSFKESQYLSSTNIRNIKYGKSDANGNFSLNFHLNDNEVGTTSPGYFTISIDQSTVSRSKYLTSESTSLDLTIFSIKKRDTIIENDLFIPEKTLLAVNLNGFSPIGSNDLFSVELLYSYGWSLDNGAINTYTGTRFNTGSQGLLSQYKATSTRYTASLSAVKYNTNIIRLTRIKNGIIQREELRVFIPDTTSYSLSYDY